VVKSSLFVGASNGRREAGINNRLGWPVLRPRPLFAC